MSKFKEIKDQFVRLRDLEDAYWQRLEEAQDLIRVGFASFLSVDPDQKIGKSGEPRIWFGGKRTIAGESEHQTIREGNELIFTLNLILDEEGRAFPPSQIATRCRLKYIAGDFFVAIDRIDGTYMNVKDDFTPFFQHMFERKTKYLGTFVQPFSE